MKKILFILGVVGALATFTACSSDTDPAKLEYEKVTDTDLGVEFEKPIGWYQNVDSETEPDLYQYIIPNQFTQEDRVEGYLGIYKMPVGEGEAPTLEDSYAILKKSREEDSAEKENYSVVSDNKDVTIFGQPAKEITVKYDVDAQDSKRTTYSSTSVVVVNNQIFLVEYYDEEPDFNKYTDVKDKLYSTLKAL